MNTSCHACGKQLKLSEKMLESIRGLGPGRSIRIKCPGCSEAIILDNSILGGETSALKPTEGSPSGKSTVGTSPVKPPAPPDIAWLEDGVFDDDQVIEDVPLALVLMDDNESRDTIIESIEGIGYKTEIVQSSLEAMEKMQFVEYSAVVLHSQYEGSGLSTSPFHKFMCDMSMSRRRFVFYTLVGKEFKTLYNLQALSHSANLVVNDTEIPYFSVIIRKAIPEYEELFGPITEELRIHGK